MLKNTAKQRLCPFSVSLTAFHTDFYSTDLLIQCCLQATQHFSNLKDKSSESVTDLVRTKYELFSGYENGVGLYHKEQYDVSTKEFKSAYTAVIH
jgi:hypothetical protein